MKLQNVFLKSCPAVKFIKNSRAGFEAGTAEHFSFSVESYTKTATISLFLGIRPALWVQMQALFLFCALL